MGSVLNNGFLGYTLLEWLLALATVALLLSLAARLLWGDEIREVEDRLFKEVGLNGWGKILIIGPLITVWFYAIYRAESKSAFERGQPVVRRSVGFAVAILLSLVVMSGAILAS